MCLNNTADDQLYRVLLLSYCTTEVSMSQSQKLRTRKGLPNGENPFKYSNSLTKNEYIAT